MLSRSRRGQRGAVVVYLAGMASVLAMMVLFLYNTGHLSNEKTRLQNTTDAAAHSVAMLQSRDFNFQAYTNRAIIANQVSIAQAVSLVSWVRFIDKGIKNIRKYTFWVPYWGAIINAIANVSIQVKTWTESIGSGVVTGINIVLQGISDSQQMMHNAVLLEIPATMINVVRANDPGVDTGVITNSALMTQLIAKHRTALTQYKPDNVKNRSGSNWKEDKVRMDEFRDVTLRSRDGFSTTRSETILKVPGFPLRFKLEKAGGTELTSSNSNAPYYTWAAMDTLSYHDSTFKCGWSGCGWSSYKERIPLGWGAAQTGDTIYYSKMRGSNFGKTWKTNKIASTLDAREFQRASEVGSFSGLRPFMDITQKGLLDTLPAMVVILDKPEGGRGIKTARDVGFGKAGTRIDVQKKGGMANNRLHAMAKAEAYFSRPNDLWNRRQGGREYGNVYNPFWQPRLAKIDTTERAAAMLLANIR